MIVSRVWRSEETIIEILGGQTFSGRDVEYRIKPYSAKNMNSEDNIVRKLKGGAERRQGETGA